MSMIDLKTTNESDSQPVAIAAPEGVNYPYGTRLDLDEATLKKLGIVELPAVGSKLMFEAKAVVIGSRQSVSEGSRSLELQITAIDLEQDEEGEEVDEGELTREEAGALSRLAKKMRGM